MGLEHEGRLALLDYGRFFAAIAVLLFHYTFNGILSGKITSIDMIPAVAEFTKYGYLGVEFFFMISGYVIFISAQNKTAGQFIRSRLIRLYPAFWFSVIFATFLTIVFGRDQAFITFQQFIANLTMVPSVFGYDLVDEVYWTLLYEITFYLAVFFLIAFGAERKLKKIVLFWPFLMLFAWLLQLGYLPFLAGYYAFFAAGAVFAILKDERSVFAWGALLVAFGICIDFVRDIAAMKTASQSVHYAPEIACTIIVIFFLYFTFLNTRVGLSVNLPQSRLLGNLTYPIYLLHLSLGYMLINNFATNENKYMVYGIVILIVFSLSFLVHRFIEIDLKGIWKSLFGGDFLRHIHIRQRT